MGQGQRALLEDQPGTRRRGGRVARAADPILVGADNAAINVTPNTDRAVSNPIHQIMLVVNGIHLLENLKLDELAARRAFEFALVVQPLKIQGGSGSTVAPIALR